MRIDLRQLTAQGLTLELPGTDPGTGDRRIVVRSADALRGTFTLAKGGWQVGNAACEEVVLEPLSLRFGTVGLALGGVGTLRKVRLGASGVAGTVETTASAEGLEAARLDLSVGPLRLGGQLAAHGFELGIEGASGHVAASEATLSGVELRYGALSLSSPALRIERLQVTWGAGTFRLEAKLAQTDVLSGAQDAIALQAAGVVATDIHVAGAEVEVGNVQLASLELAVALARRARGERGPESATPARERARPLLDYHMLDELFGRIRADVHVDMTVPVIGRRRATHTVRIAVDQGSVDYRALEHSLAALEDSLLDFSLRESALVLELGVPLLSTRGRGKPLMIWDLSEADRVLAEQRRVRLAVLPQVRMAGGDKSDRPSQEPGEKKPSGPIALRAMSIAPLDVELSLRPAAAPSNGALESLTIGQAKLAGELHHVPGAAPRRGRVSVELAELEGALVDLAVGRSALDVTVRVAALQRGELSFEGLRPTHLQAVLQRVELANLSLGARDAGVVQAPADAD